MIRPLLAVALLAGSAVGFDDAAKKTYVLPKDAKAPVIQLDYKGGFTPPRKKQDPALSILSDGTVLMPDRFGSSKDVSGTISADEVQGLLRFILDEHDFTKVDAAKMKKEILAAEKKRGGFAPRIADAPSLWVKVSTRDTTHESQYYALSMAARQNPTVESLQDFDAIAKKLQRVMNVTRGGGAEKVAAMLKLANAQLKKQHPDAEPFSKDDLSYVANRPDGSTHYNFSWRAEGMPGVPATTTYANGTVVVPATGEPTVTVRAKL